MIEYFNIEFKVKPQTARIQVGGADQGIFIVDQQQFAVHERRRLKEDVGIQFQQFEQIGTGSPGHIRQVIFFRQQDVDPHTAQGGRIDGGQLGTIGDEVGGHDADMTFGAGHSADQQPVQFFMLFIGAGADAAAAGRSDHWR